jgi:hypothetical protein
MSCTVIKENEAKRRIPVCGGYKMMTQAILPPPQDADSSSKLADLGKAANPHVTVGSKVAEGQDVTSHVTICGFRQSHNFSVNSLMSGFCKKPFSKIDVGTSYLPYCSVKICPSLSCELGNQICSLYSKVATI